MGKETKHRREDKKKPTMTLKERRAKKQEKRHPRHEEHRGEEPLA